MADFSQQLLDWFEKGVEAEKRLDFEAAKEFYTKAGRLDTLNHVTFAALQLCETDEIEDAQRSGGGGGGGVLDPETLDAVHRRIVRSCGHPMALSNLAFLMLWEDVEEEPEVGITVDELFKRATVIRWIQAQALGFQVAEVGAGGGGENAAAAKVPLTRDRIWQFETFTNEEAEDILARQSLLRRDLASIDNGTDGQRFEALSHLGMLLLEARNPDYDPLLSLCVFRYGSEQGDAECAFWLGRSLKTGQGCQFDRSKLGNALVEAAAARRVPRALFEMGMMYEHGYRCPGGSPNIPFATVFYEAVARATSKTPAAPSPTTPEAPPAQDARRTRILDNFEVVQIGNNPDWHKLEDLINDMFSRTITWELVGQAFLFGAAAQVPDESWEKHEKVLFAAFIPAVGVVFALLCLSSSLSVIYINKNRRSKQLRLLYNAKVMACRCLVGERRSVESFVRWRTSPDTYVKMVIVVEWLFLGLCVLFLVAWCSIWGANIAAAAES